MKTGIPTCINVIDSRLFFDGVIAAFKWHAGDPEAAKRVPEIRRIEVALGGSALIRAEEVSTAANGVTGTSVMIVNCILTPFI